MDITAVNDKEQQVLRIYEQDPMPDGDGLLLLDDEVCLELAGMVGGVARDGSDALVGLLTEAASTSVRLLIARRGAALQPEDYRVWRELHSGLRDTGIELRTLWALPAA